ncbi:hypothetical protein NUKP65_36280 [Klebsiella variicola]|nr:hypothetical protein NUKP65_36280 [Klebsiella variicola]
MPLRGQKKARGVGGQQAQHFLMRPTPPLSLLSLSCGACLAEKKDAPCRDKKKPAGSAGNKHNIS